MSLSDLPDPSPSRVSGSLPLSLGVSPPLSASLSPMSLGRSPPVLDPAAPTPLLVSLDPLGLSLLVYESYSPRLWLRHGHVTTKAQDPSLRPNVETVGLSLAPQRG